MPEIRIKQRDLYKLWLERNYRAGLEAIDLAFIFGSVARQCSSYNDCDLMICCNSVSGESSWERLISCNESNKVKFEEEFGLPLSVIVLTRDEYQEDIPVLYRIKSGPKIYIY